MDVWPMQLRATRMLDNGDMHDVYVKVDTEMHLALRKGGHEHTPHHVETGIVSIVLGVDGEHDQVCLDMESTARLGTMSQLASRALEALEVAADALKRVEESSG